MGKLSLADSVLSTSQMADLISTGERIAPALHLTSLIHAPGGQLEVGYDPAFGPPTSDSLAPLEKYGPNTIKVVARAPAIPLAGTTDPTASDLELRYQSGGNRLNDISPFWGGARTHPPDFKSGKKNACSTGFPAYNTQTGTYYLLAAWHCGYVGADVRTASGAELGSVSVEDPTLDAALITVDAPNWVQARVYDNPPTTGATWGHIYGSANMAGGDNVCVDGSVSRNTGCDTVAVAYEQGAEEIFNDYEGYKAAWVTGWWVRGNKAIAGSGDSGGPVIAPVTIGSSQGWYAKGIISAADPNRLVTCPDYVQNDPDIRNRIDPSELKCAGGALVSGIGNIKDHWPNIRLWPIPTP